MSVTAQSIIDRVRLQLIDNGAVKRWSDTELLLWLSDGQRAIVTASPGNSSSTEVVPLVAGTKQNIPSDGNMLLYIVRNTNSSGTTAGRAVRIVSREILDAQNPDWHSSTAAAVVQNYIFDPQEPTKYYVYPPNTGTGYVEMVYSHLPGEMTSLTDTLVVQDIYQTALFDYVMFRAHQKDSDFAAGQAIATTYLQLFLAAIGQRDGGILQANPNLQLANPDPSTRGSAKI
jgi:hypothetical protein